MKCIAMIPARMGSKRIPKKNIRLLRGKPLINYAIDLAIQSQRFDEIWVNSESDLLNELAIGSGVKFHKRPVELSSDDATNEDFTTEFLGKHECEFLIMLNPTSPLLRVETVRYFYDFVADNDYDTVFSVADEYAECFCEGRPLNFSSEKKISSQDLTPVQKVVWALTAWRRSTFLKAVRESHCGIFAGRIGLFAIPKDESCDLDTLEDWAIAEGMLIARTLKKEPPSYWSTVTDHRVC
jgi:CMP-N-acetylneuraminic acid synthetase